MKAIDSSLSEFVGYNNVDYFMILSENKNLKVKNGVVIMKDGTMFLRQKNRAQEQFAHLLANKKLNKSNVDNFNKSVKRNSEYCEKNNIPYLQVVFPAKPCVYIDQFREIGLNINPIYSEQHTSDNVYYPQDELDQSHFIKDNTHNSFKGYYQIISNAMSLLGYDIKSYGYKTHKLKVTGDLGVMSQGAGVESEYLKEFDLDSDITTFSTTDSLGANEGEIYVSVNPLAPNQKRILLFGDSFFVGCIPILSHFFEEVVYIRTPFIINDVANILEPDIILTGSAERYLVQYPDPDYYPPYFLKYFTHKFDTTKLSDAVIAAFDAIFSGKKSMSYQTWIKRRRLESFIRKYSVEKPAVMREIDTDLINRIRNEAIRYEENNMRTAYKLMQIAHKARPNGPLIRDKVEQYRSALGV